MAAAQARTRRRSPGRWPLGWRVASGVVAGIVALTIIILLRGAPSLPTSALFTYQFHKGQTANYHIVLTLTNTVSGHGNAASTLTQATMLTHEEVVSVDAHGVATLRLTFTTAQMSLDHRVLPSPLNQLTPIMLTISPQGMVQSVQMNGQTQGLQLHVTGNGSQTVHTVTQAAGLTEPLQNVLGLLQGGLQSFPSGTIGVGETWQRASVINAPYMLLLAAIAHSKLNGFEMHNGVAVAVIGTHATAPVDLVSATGTPPTHITGQESLDITGYFVPNGSSGGVLLGTQGSAHLAVRQHTEAVTSSASDIQSSVVLSFTVSLQS